MSIVTVGNRGTTKVNEVVAEVNVLKDGASVGTQKKINFQTGNNTTVEVTDDGAKIDVKYNSTASGGIGGSTGATDNAILRADEIGGATLKSSDVIIDDTANITLGIAATAGLTRTITASGLEDNISVNMVSKGTGQANISSQSIILRNPVGFGIWVYAPDETVQLLGGSSGNSTIKTSNETLNNSNSEGIIIKTGDAGTGGTGNHNSGNLLFDLGAKAGSGTVGNIGLFTTSVANWQAMEKGMFIGNATTVPTGNPTGGGFLYVEAGALKYRGSSGTVTTLGPA